MTTNEKLKLASQQAETDLLNILPPDLEIEWQPSDAFETKMQSVLGKNIKREYKKRRIIASAVAAIFLTAGAFMCISMLLKEPPAPVAESNTSDLQSDIKPEIPFEPQYIPEGYTFSKYTDLTNGAFEIEYTNGQETILFCGYPAEGVDLLVYDEIVGSVYINGKLGYTANNRTGYLNNCVWNNAGYSFVVSNTSDISMDELVRIASSVNSDIEKEVSK